MINCAPQSQLMVLLPTRDDDERGKCATRAKENKSKSIMPPPGTPSYLKPFRTTHHSLGSSQGCNGMTSFFQHIIFLTKSLPIIQLSCTVQSSFPTFSFRQNESKWRAGELRSFCFSQSKQPPTDFPRQVRTELPEAGAASDFLLAKT